MADAIVLFLRGSTIPAHLIPPDPRCLTGISATPDPAADFEVWVEHVSDAEPARQLIPHVIENMREVMAGPTAEDQRASDQLARQEEIREFKARKAKQKELIPVKCDECEKVSGFPATQTGTVQECPHCGEYMDVPELDGAPESPFPPDIAEPDME
jgi:hypothetical protein